MKRVVFITALLGWAVIGLAQTNTSSSVAQLKLDEARARLEDFDTEHLLDSLDQEKLPRIVSGGVFGGANMSNFIIARDHQSMSSFMRVGAEIGGMLDFSVTKHFAVQPQVILTAHQNRFAVTDSANLLWSFGAEIPIYFLGRYGSLENGYIQFGGGLFTHFTFASNVNIYRNIEASQAIEVSPVADVPDADYDYSRLYNLHNNHFGICLLAGYECRFGMFVNATYKVSVSDIAGFYSEMKGQEIAEALIFPQSVSLNIGYRWR